MKYYSTNRKSPAVSLKETVLSGLAPDGGLYLPTELPLFTVDYFKKLRRMSLQDIALEVSGSFFGDEIPEKILSEIVNESLNIPLPLIELSDNIYSFELFNGPIK